MPAASTKYWWITYGINSDQCTMPWCHTRAQMQTAYRYLDCQFTLTAVELHHLGTHATRLWTVDLTTCTMHLGRASACAHVEIQKIKTHGAPTFSSLYHATVSASCQANRQRNKINQEDQIHQRHGRWLSAALTPWKMVLSGINTMEETYQQH